MRPVSGSVLRVELHAASEDWHHLRLLAHRLESLVLHRGRLDQHLERGEASQRDSDRLGRKINRLMARIERATSTLTPLVIREDLNDRLARDAEEECKRPRRSA